MGNRKKVVLVTRSAVIGGVEEHVSQLARYLVTRQCSVIWLVLSGEGLNRAYRRIPGVRFVILDDKEGQSVTSFFLLGRLLHIVWRFKPCIVHLHGIRPMLLLSLIPFPLHTRRISTLHASYLLMAMDSTGRTITWKRFVSILFHLFSCWRSQRIIAVSQFLADEISQTISPFEFSKMQVVHNGVDCTRPPTKNPLPDKVAETFSANEMQVVFVGRLEAKKGIELIIRAISMLSPSVRVRCHLFGDGYQRAKFESLAKAENVNDRVHFWGNLNGASQFLSEFDVLVLPSFSEGMGIAALEAMAAGLPVVATRTGGIPEAVVDEETGYLIEAGDFKALAERLELLFQDAEKRRLYGQAGRKRVFELFNRPRQLEKICTVYSITG